MELESYEDWILLYIGVPEKSTVPVDAIIAIIGKKGEDFQALINSSSSSSTQSNLAEPITEAVEKNKEDSSPKKDVSGIKATILRMPKMSDTMIEGVIAKWLKKVGDMVVSVDILAEV